MEKIIQIAVGRFGEIFAVTSEGRLFEKEDVEANWKEVKFPPLHTNEVKGENINNK